MDEHEEDLAARLEAVLCERERERGLDARERGLLCCAPIGQGRAMEVLLEANDERIAETAGALGELGCARYAALFRSVGEHAAPPLGSARVDAIASFPGVRSLSIEEEQARLRELARDYVRASLVLSARVPVAEPPAPPRAIDLSTFPRNVALEAKIVAAPSDLGARAVYVDWLIDRTALAELSSIQLARATSVAAPRALREAWLEDVFRRIPWLGCYRLSFTWVRGFIDAIELMAPFDPSDVTALFAVPFFRFARTLKYVDFEGRELPAAAIAALPCLEIFEGPASGRAR